MMVYVFVRGAQRPGSLIKGHRVPVKTKRVNKSRNHGGVRKRGWWWCC